MGHPAAPGSLHSARAPETYHQVKMSTNMSSMNNDLKLFLSACVFIVCVFLGYYGWSQSTAWTV